MGSIRIGQSPAASYSDGSVANETTYTYMVRAVDLAANESADSGTATVATKTKTKGKGSNKGGGGGGDSGGGGGGNWCDSHPGHPKC